MAFKKKAPLHSLVKSPLDSGLSSPKQMKVLKWWTQGSPYKDCWAIIADGAVRAGKTLFLSLSFVLWAMDSFEGQQFGMAGKTIGSFRRNVFNTLKAVLIAENFTVDEYRTDNAFTVTDAMGRTNTFYMFGGKDEASQDLVQGITLAGFFFDEVALMPESFVNQATARCSVEGSKLWFNCNPEGPKHWFKVEWVDQLAEKHAYHLHFTMDDNPSLSEETKARYRSMYAGIFYKRYILGLWVLAEGVIYPMFDPDVHTKRIIHEVTYKQVFLQFDYVFVSVDYGIQNPMVFNLIGRKGNTYHVIRSYYHSGRDSGNQKTDQEYVADMDEFVGDLKENIKYVIVDPSATSFIVALRRAKYFVKKAKNDVLPGIMCVAALLQNLNLTVDPSCTDGIAEFSNYIWDAKASENGKDEPVKLDDHFMDALRYGVFTDLKLNPSGKRPDVSEKRAH